MPPFSGMILKYFVRSGGEIIIILTPGRRCSVRDRAAAADKPRTLLTLLVSDRTDLINDTEALGILAPPPPSPSAAPHWPPASEAGSIPRRGLAGAESVSMFKPRRELNRGSQ